MLYLDRYEGTMVRRIWRVPMPRLQLAGAWPLALAAVCIIGGVAAGILTRPQSHRATAGSQEMHTTHVRMPGGMAPAPDNSAYGSLRQPSLAPKSKPKPFSFPGGKHDLSGNYRFVALYGTPGEPALGALGDQDLDGALARVQHDAADYQPLSPQPVYPTFEIIATVASGTPTDNGDYSREVDAGVVQAWAEAAQRAGVYVVLDLQPGRSDFLTQAKEYAQVLRLPNVGLALDPEWRLTADQVPLKQIGAVGIDEVNGVSDWLAALVQDNRLPQKLFVLHQFRLDMLPDRAQLNTGHPQLSYVIQMDGQGTQDAKNDTWRTITADPPANVVFGWKNFLSQDQPMLTPAQTMQLAPVPWYISYQ